jgi:Bacterial Ig-like domain (group 3)
VLIDNNAPAYAAKAGYDLATGLGSVNGANLINAIATAAAGFTPTTTALTLNGGTTQVTAKHGDPISVAVNVTPTTATGPVSLVGPSRGIDGSTLSGGLANWSTRLLPGGNYNVAAHYPGDGTRAASDSNGVSVNIASESSQTFVNLVTFDLNGALLSYTANTAAYGSPYVLRMDVAEASATLSTTKGISSNCSQKITSCPTGTIALTANGAPLDGGSFRLNSAGTAEDLHIQLSPSTYNTTAAYPGDASYSTSTANKSIIITPAPVTFVAGIGSAGPFEYGASTSLYAGVTTTSNGSQPGGTVTFYDNGVPMNLPFGIQYSGAGFYPTATPPYAWLNASSQYGFTPLGSHTLTAQYSGDQNYAPATSAPFTFTVVPAHLSASTFGAGPNPSTPLLPVTLTLGFYGTSTAPTGSVTFTDNGNALPGTVNYASYGNHGITATLTYTFTQLGSHNLVATYAGDTNYVGFSQSLGTLVVSSKLATAFSQFWAPFNPALVNYPTTIRADFSAQSYAQLPSLTGTVSFFDNGSQIGDTNSITYVRNGTYVQATLSYTFTATGDHKITARYDGDTIYDIGQSTLLVMTVDSKLPSSVSRLWPTMLGPVVVNQPATLVASVDANVYGPNLTGTVTFLENGTPLDGTVEITGFGASLQATLTHTFTTTGLHNITARYEGDSNHLSSTISPLALTVEGPLWLNMTQTQTTFDSSGGNTQVGFWVDNNTATDSPVTLTCISDLPAGTCTLTATSFTVPARSPYYTNFTVSVPAHGANLHAPSNFWRHTGGLVFFGMVLGITLFDRRRKLLLIMPTLVLVVGLLSCGGGGGGGNTGGGGGGVTPPPVIQPVIYHFTITATGGGNTATAVYPVTVQ